MARDPIEFDSVITAFYEAVTDASLWMPALAGLATYLGSVLAAQSFMRDAAKNVYFAAVSSDVFASTNEAYARHYVKIDPRMPLVESQPVGALFACHKHFDDAYVAKSEYYQDCLLPAGGRYVMGTKLIETSSFSAFQAILRSSKQGPFEAADFKRFARIQPHLTQAFQLFRKFQELGAARDRVSAALDRAPWGIVVTDENGAILELNAAADTLLRRGDAIRARHNKIEATAVERANELHRLIHDAAAAAGGAASMPGGFIQIERAGTTGTLTVLVAPLRQATQTIGFKASARVILFIADSEQQSLAPSSVLGQLYGLTPSEAAVALAIAAGKTMEEIAELNRVSRNTIRVQTQSVLSKTGVRRQAELVRLILQLPTMR